MPPGLELMWRVSHIIIMPMRSQAATHSGVGMLCEVRTALQPMPCSTPTRNACSWSGSAAPTPAWSWWLQVPWIFRDLPLRKKPRPGSNAAVRMPNGNCSASRVAPSTITLTSAV